MRIVAATHADLDGGVRTGRFRQDLYYRLNVIQVRVPPLRERMEDLIPLVRHFLAKSGRRLGRPAVSIEPEALEALRRHDWPGNVRELENAIERALVLGRSDRLSLGDLPSEVRGRTAPSPPVVAASLAGIEREHIIRTLHAVRGTPRRGRPPAGRGPQDTLPKAQAIRPGLTPPRRGRRASPRCGVSPSSRFAAPRGARAHGGGAERGDAPRGRPVAPRACDVDAASGCDDGPRVARESQCSRSHIDHRPEPHGGTT